MPRAEQDTIRGPEGENRGPEGENRGRKFSTCGIRAGRLGKLKTCPYESQACLAPYAAACLPIFPSLREPDLPMMARLARISGRYTPSWGIATSGNRVRDAVMRRRAASRVGGPPKRCRC